MRVSWWLIALVVFAPSAALACPVCGTGPEQSRAAYINMTAVLSLLPLGMVGGLIYFFVRRVRRLDAQEGSRQKVTP